VVGVFMGAAEATAATPRVAAVARKVRRVGFMVKS
jgi:hypothetical protein